MDFEKVYAIFNEFRDFLEFYYKMLFFFYNNGRKKLLRFLERNLMYY